MHTRLIGTTKVSDTPTNAPVNSQETTIVVHRDEDDAGGEKNAPLASSTSMPEESYNRRTTANSLPIGTQIHEFKITDVIAIGGFGIVYLAQDLSLGRYVALKEYMPTSLAERLQGTTVAVKSAQHADTFNAGLRSFVNEARLLAQFDHPALVKVYRFWEENGTAYMVMPFLEGVTLQKALAEMPGPPDERWLKDLLAQLLDALEIIHREHCFHRDISPDNILILSNGRPLLLDFGAARRIIGDMNQALTVILKPSYAPPEQYAENPEARQGAWTDLYALGAVIYCAITGKPPTPSISRVLHDSLLPLAQTVVAGRYSPEFLQAIDWALHLKPENRPQSVAEWRAVLFLQNEAPAADSKEMPLSAPQKKSPWGKIMGGLLALAVGVAVALFIIRPAPDAKREVPASAVAIAVPPTAQTAEITEIKANEQSQVFDALKVLDRVFEQRNRDHPVSVTTDPPTVKIGRDKLRFRINSPKAGYLYILMVGTDRNHFNLLFPNSIDPNNKVSSGKELSLPRPGWAMTAGGPAGTNHFVAIVSESPRDFLAAGLVNVDGFGEFPPETAAKIAAVRSGPSPFAGKPVCPSSNNCSSAYGAAIFSIQEIN